MPARNNPNPAAEAYQPPEGTHATDTQTLLNTLNHVFSAFREQLRTEEPDPFTGNAKTAADTFNDILAGLTFESRRPSQFQLQAGRISPAVIGLTWSDARADSYRVERCQGHDCEDFDEIISRLPSTQRSFRDNVTKDSFLRYRVVAVDARGETTSNVVGVGPRATTR
jgi:hypothetical protein